MVNGVVPIQTQEIFDEVPVSVAPTVIIDAGHGGEDGGAVSACGTHSELLEKSTIYQEVYNQQTRGGEKDE